LLLEKSDSSEIKFIYKYLLVTVSAKKCKCIMYEARNFTMKWAELSYLSSQNIEKTLETCPRNNRHSSNMEPTSNQMQPSATVNTTNMPVFSNTNMTNMSTSFSTSDMINVSAVSAIQTDTSNLLPFVTMEPMESIDSIDICALLHSSNNTTNVPAVPSDTSPVPVPVVDTTNQSTFRTVDWNINRTVLPYADTICNAETLYPDSLVDMSAKMSAMHHEENEQSIQGNESTY